MYHQLIRRFRPLRLSLDAVLPAMSVTEAVGVIKTSSRRQSPISRTLKHTLSALYSVNLASEPRSPLIRFMGTRRCGSFPHYFEDQRLLQTMVTGGGSLPRIEQMALFGSPIAPHECLQRDRGRADSADERVSI